MHHEYLK